MSYVIAVPVSRLLACGELFLASPTRIGHFEAELAGWSWMDSTRRDGCCEEVLGRMEET